MLTPMEANKVRFERAGSGPTRMSGHQNIFLELSDPMSASLYLFSTRKTQLSDPGSQFGWPKGINKNGFFYSNTISEKEVFRVLKNTFSCSNGTWREKTTKIFEGIINYNFNNKKFFKIINKHI